jgi:hypothetical protein
LVGIIPANLGVSMPETDSPAVSRTNLRWMRFAEGKLAVLKLKVALINNRDALTRAHVAICLGSIGGADARKALEQALYRESDEQVRKHLKRALSTLAVVKKQVR